MHRALILTPLALLIPAEAYACINSMYRDVAVPFATQPLEYLHYGIFIAAVVLLRWRGQPHVDQVWDPDQVLGADDQLPEEERHALKSRKPEWPISRQVAFAAVALLTSFGIGLFAADALTIASTPMTDRAAWAAGFLALGLSMSLRQSGSESLVALRQLFLMVAVVVSATGIYTVSSGELTRTEKVDPVFSAPIPDQVTF